jgi:hypothetical protein
VIQLTTFRSKVGKVLLSWELFVRASSKQTDTPPRLSHTPESSWRFARLRFVEVRETQVRNELHNLPKNLTK